MNLAKTIKKEREKKNWTQEELAQKMFVSRQSISKWELGEAYPDIKKLIKLGELFEISLDNLVKGKVEKEILVENQVQNKNSKQREEEVKEFSKQYLDDEYARQKYKKRRTIKK